MSTQKLVVIVLNSIPSGLFSAGWSVPKAIPDVAADSVQNQLAEAGVQLRFYNGTGFVSTSQVVQRLFNAGWDSPDPQIEQLADFQARRGEDVTVLIATPTANGPDTWKWKRINVKAPAQA